MAAVGEEPSKELDLRVRGVLELVEQHHAVALPLRGAAGPILLGKTRRVAEQIAEVHDLGLLLGLLIALRHAAQHAGAQQAARGFLGVLGDLLLLAPRSRRGLEHGLPEPSRVPPDLVEVQQVLSGARGQREDLLDRRGHPQIGRDLTVPGLHDPRGDLPGLGRAEQRGLRLQADPQPVGAHERAGIRVVGQHRGLEHGRGVPLAGGGAAVRVGR